MATKNAIKGHKVLYISLEMSKEAIKADFARKYAGITVEEEYHKKIPDTKQMAYAKRLKEIEEISNLIFEGLRRGMQAEWKTLLEIINKYQGLDLIFIDNLDKIAGDDDENNNEKQKRIMGDLMGFTEERQIPVVLIHHHRKTAQGKDFGMDELSGSGKIADDADIVVKVLWEQKEEYPDKYATKIQLQKARGYPLASKTIYFIRGTFVDIPPSYETYYNVPPPNYDYGEKKDEEKMEEITALF